MKHQESYKTKWMIEHEEWARSQDFFNDVRVVSMAANIVGGASLNGRQHWKVEGTNQTYAKWSEEQVKTAEQVFVDESTYNYVTISADTGSSEVKEVRFLAREGNNGSWFIISEYEKTGTDHNTDAFIVFANDVVRKYVTDEQSSTFYSDVPLLARDVKAVANRLV